MAEQFTWIPLYKELAKLLLEWEDRQPELISCLDTMRSEGVKVTALTDKDEDGNRFLIREIDPFTIFGSFNRQIRDEERLAILKTLRELLGARSPLPTDFDGLPIMNNQQSWFVSYQSNRKREDVPTLWKLFRVAQEDTPLEDPEFSSLFDACQQIRLVSVNLTMGLFWIRPETFLNLDRVNRKYLNIELPKSGLNSEFYQEVLRRASRLGKSFPEISVEAYQATQADIEGVGEPNPDDHNYWLVGSYWTGTDSPDQTERFLSEGIWQNGYTDKYLDEVRSIEVGDRIAIKSSSTQKNGLPFDANGKTVSRMTIKAIGTVVANRNDGRTVEVEWQPDYESRDWYFYTDRHTIWKVRIDEAYQHRHYSRRLIDFVWNATDQDYAWFIDALWSEDGSDNAGVEIEGGDSPTEPYSVEDILASGVFVAEETIRKTLNRLRLKKNLILQGAPGVGKTYLARKLAYALMEEKADDRLEMIQFHQSFTYEDFIRGYRPLPDQAGTFGLQDAVFYEFCQRAQDDPDRDYVFIIDEINRGNVSQIFGELLMLIEGDKRGPQFAVPLVYRKTGEPNFFVPANVYLIGLMNLADRSLAIVDYALRRRFAFMTLVPQYASELFRSWLLERQMNETLMTVIAERMTELNRVISEDPLLGEHYQVGHSFFCPKGDDFSHLGHDWFDEIVETEIQPLLQEYWFDNPQKVEQTLERLRSK